MRRRSPLPLLLAAVALSFFSPGRAAALQEPVGEPLRVFLECGPCDPEFVRQTVTYIAWMRDRQDADVHVIQRSQVTGGGGRQHTLDVIGLQRYEGRADTLRYVQGPDDTQDVTRRGLVRVLTVGLMRYLADTPIADRLQISVAPEAAGAPSPPAGAGLVDPWNAWVFTIGGNGNTNGESSQTFTNIGVNFAANRVTEEWKINTSLRGSYGEQRFTFSPTGGGPENTVLSISRSYNASALIVNSVGEHGALGLRSTASISTFGNTELAINLQSAAEYNLFPYAESTRRQLTFTYYAGVTSQKYREETIYSRTAETRPVHSASVSYSTRQAWGNTSVGVSSQQYLHDISLYNLNFSLNASVNVFRGLSLNFSGNYTMVRDQLNLPKRNLTEEEVLLRQRAIATNYRYFSSFGMTYRFGSSVQSVVNPRL